MVKSFARREDEIINPVVEELSRKDIEKPQDFRVSDDWDQYRFENTDDECKFCGNDTILHLHHTTVPPDLKECAHEIAREMYRESGRYKQYLKRPSERCKKCGCLHCSHDVDGSPSPEEAIEKMGRNRDDISVSSFSDEIHDDMGDFVEENVFTIMSMVLDEWREYIETYKSDENLITLCGKCHFLYHRYECKPCAVKGCNNTTPPLDRLSRVYRDGQKYVCGVCKETRTQSEWDTLIEKLLQEEMDSYTIEADNICWNATYDKIWNIMANNSKII